MRASPPAAIQPGDRRQARRKTRHGYVELVSLVNHLGPRQISISDVDKRMTARTAGAYVDRVDAYQEFCDLNEFRSFPLQLSVLRRYVAYRLSYVTPKMIMFDLGALRSVAALAGNLKISAADMSALLLKSKKISRSGPRRQLKGIPKLLACVPSLTPKLRRQYAEFLRHRLQTVNSATVYADRYQRFERVCRARGVRALPATHAALAAFIALRAKSVSPRTIRLDLCAIRLVHEIAGFDDPVADQRIHDLITGVTRSKAPGRLHPIAIDELRRAVAPLNDKFVFECRDRCLLLLLFAAGLISRTARLIDRSRIVFEADGSLILNTDDRKRPQIRVRPGRHSRTCPVRATLKWLDVIGREPGPLFPAWDPRGAWSSRALSETKIFLTVRERCRRVGIASDRLCARSLRQGFLIAASRTEHPGQIAEYVGMKIISLEHHTGRLAVNKVMDDRKQRAITKRRWAKRSAKRPALELRC